MTAAQPQVQVQQSSERPRSCCRRSSTSSTSTSSTSSTVSFDTVEIRGYYITLGDNPSCSRGPPISLDWKYEQELVMKVEEYEQHHQQQQTGRRSKEQMIVPAVVREEMIRTNTDYTRSEIQDTVQEIQKIQKSRQKNATHSVRRQRNEELLESITKRILTRRNSLMMVPSEEKKTNQPVHIDDDTASSTTSNRRPSLGSRIVRSIQISSTCRGKQ